MIGAMSFRATGELVFFMVMSVSIYSNSACAKLVEHIAPETEIFLFSLPKDRQPIISGRINSRNINSPLDFKGSVFLSCFDERIDTFRLNVILYDDIVSMFSNPPTLFFALSRMDNVESASMWGHLRANAKQGQDELPETFGFDYSITAYAQNVKAFDEYSISTLNHTYVSSYPSASFFEGLQSSNRLIFFAYFEETETYETMFELYYELSQEAANSFIQSCVGRERSKQ